MSIIEVKNVFFSYLEKQKLLSDITFSVKKGDFVAILGSNGTGKSTLLKIILGKIVPKKGTVTIKDIGGKKAVLSYVPQKATIDPNHPARVEELVRDKDICSQLKIDTLLKKQYRELSGGQQQRVLVGLALENNPDILLLDEPTEGIDVDTRTNFYKLIKHLSEEHGKTTLIVTHDNELIQKYADKMFCIDDQHHFSYTRCVHD